MNRHFLVTLGILLLPTFIYADGDTPPQGEEQDWTHVIRRSPRRRNLSVNYEEGILYISDRVHETGTVVITIFDLDTETESKYSVTLNEGEAELYLSLQEGEYLIEVQSETETLSTTLYI